MFPDKYLQVTEVSKHQEEALMYDNQDEIELNKNIWLWDQDNSVILSKLVSLCWVLYKK